MDPNNNQSMGKPVMPGADIPASSPATSESAVPATPGPLGDAGSTVTGVVGGSGVEPVATVPIPVGEASFGMSGAGSVPSTAGAGSAVSTGNAPVSGSSSMGVDEPAEETSGGTGGVGGAGTAD